MSAMKNLVATLTENGIDFEKWDEAHEGKGDFSDFLVAHGVAVALGLEPNNGSVEDPEAAMRLAVKWWPAGDRHLHHLLGEPYGGLAPNERTDYGSQ